MQARILIHKLNSAILFVLEIFFITKIVLNKDYYIEEKRTALIIDPAGSELGTTSKISAKSPPTH